MATATSTGHKDEPVYSTARRKGIGKRVRYGPTPIEDTNERKKERPGQLSLSKISSDESRGLAGSIELLAYFLRLSQEDSNEEAIDTNYIMALIKSGADINSVDDYGQTVLHAAARDWNPDSARFLIDIGADVNKADKYGRTPIFTATVFDYPEMIEFLASRGANIHKQTNGEKQTTVHYAARGNAVSSLKMLLKLGVDVVAEDYKGRSPLFIAAEQGNADVMQYLLDIGCPAASYDKYGYSAMAHMVEKMPNIALEALSQFASVNSSCDKKSYFLAPLEFDVNNSLETWDQKNALQMIVKYKETDLLLHPVIQRLLKVKWDTYARFYILNYFFLNLIYVLLWSVLAIVSSAVKDAFLFEKENAVVLSLSSLALLLTIASAIEQFMLVRSTQRQENRWKESRIASLQQDLRYCHPQWPNERESVESQMHRYSSMLSDNFKSFWIYQDGLTFFAIIVWDVSRIILAIPGEMTVLEETARISLTVVIFLVWLKFLKACRAFKIGGQYIALLQQVIIALCKFAFLFFMFYIPFVVIFWVMFGGDEYGDKIAAKYGKIGDAFRKFNDVAYTVWTLTVLVGIPMRALKVIDETLIISYVAVYYLVMSVITLNLFIAFLSNVFARVYKDAKKYALLEQATTILLSENFLRRKKKKRILDYMRKECNPLTERLKFRETLAIHRQSPESTLQNVKSKMQTVAELLQGKRLAGIMLNRKATTRQIDHNMNMSLNTLNGYDLLLGKIQKFHVEIKKIQRVLGCSSPSTADKSGKSDKSNRSKRRS